MESQITIDEIDKTQDVFVVFYIILYYFVDRRTIYMPKT